MKSLKKDGMAMIKQLNKIRNDWAHAPGKGMNENEADDAIHAMIELIEIIDKDMSLSQNPLNRGIANALKQQDKGQRKKAQKQLLNIL